MAYFVADTVNALDLSSFYERYEGDGRRNRPYHPAMMVKVLIYAYATGVFSSRKIAKKLEEDVAFKMLAGGNLPAHRTICDFRHDHLLELSLLFVQVVELAREAGLVKLGTVALDGSKVKANASRHKAMSYSRMKQEEARLKSEIDKLLDRAEAQDRIEDERYGLDVRGDELPKELARREERLKTIQAAKKRLEERQAKADHDKGRHEGDGNKSAKGGGRFARDFGQPEDKAQENFTDSESRIMKLGNAFEQCYNAQIAVDADNQIIVALSLSNNAADVRELKPLMDATEQVTGKLPEKLLADAGYLSKDNLDHLEQQGIDAYIALGREGKDSTKPSSHEATNRMREKLESDDGRRLYALRKSIPEPVFGWVKHVLGFRQFNLRGLAKTTCEWALVCLAVNVRRMNTLRHGAAATSHAPAAS